MVGCFASNCRTSEYNLPLAPLFADKKHQIFAIALNGILISAVDNGGLGKHFEFAGKGPVIYGLKVYSPPTSSPVHR